MVVLDVLSTLSMGLLRLVALVEGPVLLAIALAMVTSVMGTATNPPPPRSPRSW